MAAEPVRPPGGTTFEYVLDEYKLRPSISVLDQPKPYSM